VTIEELIAALQALLDTATAEARDLTDEEAERAEDLNGQIERARTRADIQLRSRTLVTPVMPPVHPATLIAAVETDDELTRAFEGYLRRGEVSPELAQYRAQAEGSGASGGFLVPEGFRNKLVERMKQFGGIANGCEVITTDSGQPLPWPTNDDTANTATIVAENGTFGTGADLVFATRSLQAFKYMAGGASNLPLKVPFELLQDSAIDLPKYIAKKLGERMARKQASSWAVGTGVNEPVGLLSTAGGLSGATALSSNTAPTYADLLNIVHAVDPAYRGEGCSWVFGDSFLKLLRGIVDLDGRPLLWNSNGSMANGGTDTGTVLLGYPVIIDQAS
jgi:HK97 family phage major capsid protein